jgi:hypothetical protein
VEINCVSEAFLFGFDQRLARVAVFVEVFREATFGAREADEVIALVRLGFDEEILIPWEIAKFVCVTGGTQVMNRKRDGSTCGGLIDLCRLVVCWKRTSNGISTRPFLSLPVFAG